MDNVCKAIHFNRVWLSGQVAAEPELSHSNHDQVFFRFFLSVQRLSGQCDVLPVMISRHQLQLTPLHRGQHICLTGQLRSFNNKSGDGPRLILSVLARQVEVCQEEDSNTIRLCGTICKPPTFRRTPLGREICDVILAVNRRYGRADYLPCICWGAVAQQTAALPVGSTLALEGRIQSRSYTKKQPDGCCERIAYEVSVMRPLRPEEWAEKEGGHCIQTPGMVY